MIMAGGLCCFLFTVRFRVQQLEQTMDQNEQSKGFPKTLDLHHKVF
jgi:hypothetical protein